MCVAAQALQWRAHRDGVDDLGRGLRCDGLEGALQRIVAPNGRWCGAQHRRRPSSHALWLQHARRAQQRRPRLGRSWPRYRRSQWSSRLCISRRMPPDVTRSIARRGYGERLAGMEANRVNGTTVAYIDHGGRRVVSGPHSRSSIWRRSEAELSDTEANLGRRCQGDAPPGAQR